MKAPDIPHRLRTWLLFLPALPIILWAVVVVLTVVQGDELEQTFERYSQQNTTVYRDVHGMYSGLTEKHLQISNLIEQAQADEWVDSTVIFYERLMQQIDQLDRVSRQMMAIHDQVVFADELEQQHTELQKELQQYREQLVKAVRSASVNLDSASKAMAIASTVYIQINQQFSAYLAQIDAHSLKGYEQLKQSTADRNTTIATTATIIAILVLAVCIALYRRLSGGFQQMLKISRAMQGRGLKKQNYYFSNDEMGYLAKRIYFMGMALDDMRQNLESRVDTRTAELQKVTKNLIHEVEKSNAMAEQLRYLAETDELTGLYNRRYFVEQFEKEWRRGQRHQRKLVLLMIDVDFFKQVNDRYGHQIGDQCLRVIANTLKSYSQRSSDLVARFGGEEFAMLLPETDLEQACSIAQNMLKRVAEINLHPVTEERRLTVSIGIGCMVERYLSSDEFFTAVDAALYEAKASGRNCYQIVSHSGMLPAKQKLLF
ncbi:diguanylate cyclase [Neptuniibacter sp.]|uniref:sensor domain-containing diguanylate cyclase n=1 Tax=Neptuniibacter sp. TaxID=1962643 RepID=UPI00260DA7A3|nr:diguanylate cyclase [Neptuniibacter sp.]MCP4595540.1 diguanylate cyclase [Neptuniibacter sp.]